MYKAPDFVKVSTKIKDVFAPYGMCERQIHGGSDHVGEPICDESHQGELFSQYMPDICYDAYIKG